MYNVLRVDCRAGCRVEAYSGVLALSAVSHVYTALATLKSRSLIEEVPGTRAGRRPKTRYQSSAAYAQPTASMTAASTPERLGAPTTITASFKPAWTERRPPVLTGVELAYPRNLGFATSGLGVAACNPALLEENGPEVCPANSHMGSGSALVEVPIGGFLYREAVQLTLLAGPHQTDTCSYLSPESAYPPSPPSSCSTPNSSRDAWASRSLRSRRCPKDRTSRSWRCT